MAVSRRLRFEILRRDSHTCRYCGASAPDVKLTVDHVTPTALGGSDDPSNLVTACAGCNGGKTSIAPDSPHVANVAEDALRWASAIRAAADRMLADLDQRNELRDEFDVAWSSWGVGEGENRKEVPRPPGWRESIDSFMASGLPMPVLIECMRMAMGNRKLQPKDVFRYMCGIGWRKVAELQEAAKGVARQQPNGAAGDEPANTAIGMYRELTSFVFGLFAGVGSKEDAQLFAALYELNTDPDDDPIRVDGNGLAAVAVMTHAADLITELRSTAQALLLRLPDGRFAELAGQAMADLDWPDELQASDLGHMYREAVLTRMFTLHVGSEAKGQEASE